MAQSNKLAIVHCDVSVQFVVPRRTPRSRIPFLTPGSKNGGKRMSKPVAYAGLKVICCCTISIYSQDIPTPYHTMLSTMPKD